MNLYFWAIDHLNLIYTILIMTFTVPKDHYTVGHFLNPNKAVHEILDISER